MLAAHRLITTRRAEGRLNHYPTESPPDPARIGEGLALRSEARRRLVRLVEERPGQTQRELADATGLSQRLVSYHLARLEEKGLIAWEGANPRRYKPAAGPGHTAAAGESDSVATAT